MPAVTESGLIPYSIDYYRRELENIWSTALSEDINIDGDSPQGQLIGLEALSLAQIDEIFTSRIRHLDLDSAEGVDLDYIGSYFNILRFAGSRTTVDVTFTRDENTPIPANYEVTDGVNNFRTVTNTPASSGSLVTIECEAVEEGPILTPIGSINRVVSYTPQISGAINNAIQTSIGRYQESDITFRYRLRTLQTRNSIGTLDAVKTNLLLVPGVFKVEVVENITNTPKVVKGVTTVANSIQCIVYGNSTLNNDDTEELVANVINYRKGLGVATDGTTTVNLQRLSGDLQVIKFTKCIEIPIKVSFRLKTYNGFASNALDRIKNSLVRYVQSFGLGDYVDDDVIKVPAIAEPFSELKGTFNVEKKSDDSAVNVQSAVNLNNVLTLALSDITITTEK